MDRWLAAVEGDHSGNARSQQKVADDRPTDVHDRCSKIDGVEQVDVPGVGPVCELDAVQTKFGTPATVAGESIATDTNRCQLKPLRADRLLPDHVHRRAVGAAAEGVPDRRLRLVASPGVDQQRHDPVADLPGRDGTVIYGGRRLGRAPRRSGTGWMGRVFRDAKLSTPGG